MLCYYRKKVDGPRLAIKVFMDMDKHLNRWVVTYPKRDSLVELNNGKEIMFRAKEVSYQIGKWYTASPRYFSGARTAYYGFHAYKPEMGKFLTFMGRRVFAVVELRGQLLEGSLRKEAFDNYWLKRVPKVLVGKKMRILAAYIYPAGRYNTIELLSELLDLWATNQFS